MSELGAGNGDKSGGLGVLGSYGNRMLLNYIHTDRIVIYPYLSWFYHGYICHSSEIGEIRLQPCLIR